MPKSNTMPMRRRVLYWLVGLAVYTTLLVPVGTILLAFLFMPPWSEEGPFRWLESSLEMLSDDEWWAGALIGCAFISLTQFLFLLPVIRLRPPQGTRPRSLTASLVMGALVAALVSTALVAGSSSWRRACCTGTSVKARGSEVTICLPRRGWCRACW